MPVANPDSWRNQPATIFGRHGMVAEKPIPKNIWSTSNVQKSNAKPLNSPKTPISVTASPADIRIPAWSQSSPQGIRNMASVKMQAEKIENAWALVISISKITLGIIGAYEKSNRCWVNVMRNAIASITHR